MKRVRIDVEQHDVRPFARVAGCDRAADAGACAGDDCDMVGK
jgi:hypothetical protein